MKEVEIDQIAEKLTARVVEKLMTAEFHHSLAEAIAKELQRLSGEYGSDLAKLGQRLDEQH